MVVAAPQYTAQTWPISGALLQFPGVDAFGLHQALTAEQQKQLWFWTVVGHKDPVGDKETWGKAVSRLQELGRHAAEVGVLLSLELYEDTYLGSADSAVQLVQDIGLSNVGLNPDIGNLIRLHRPVESWQELVQKTLPYANYWHVKNYSRDENAARGSYMAVPAPMESGLINYREAFRTAISVGGWGGRARGVGGGGGRGRDRARRRRAGRGGCTRHHRDRCPRGRGRGRRGRL